jgi:hypothetical protein
MRFKAGKTYTYEELTKETLSFDYEGERVSAPGVSAATEYRDWASISELSSGIAGGPAYQKTTNNQL